MIADHLAGFNFRDFEPTTQFARRGTTETPFEYPYSDNVLAFWTETRAYVERYLAISCASDQDVADDADLGRWIYALNLLVPNGVGSDRTLDWLARLCATVIHVSTTEHDVLNNVVWNTRRWAG